MEDFHQQFSLEAAEKLKHLHKNLQNAEAMSDAEKREIFRTLHTIKGTAQTFGFSASSRLAHELETILSAERFITPEKFRTLFTEGISFLIKSLEQKDLEFPARFAEKVRLTIPENLQPQTSFEIFLPEIPDEIVKLLSQREKITLDSAIKLGRNIYCFEVSFDTSNFADKLIECREDLTKTGEIVATFPGAARNSANQIGFRILCANSAKKAQLEEIAGNYGAKITFDISPENFSNDLRGIAARAVAHGKNIARKLGKTVDFAILGGETRVSDEILQLVFDVLLHLIRNAVDHGIENSGGQVKIGFYSEKRGLKIVVTDNGNGIDVEKLKTKALEKNLISADEILTEQATFELIFQSELSTAPQVTEISGRGVGLDAVKASVEKFGGTINVESQSGKGTTFEVFLRL